MNGPAAHCKYWWYVVRHRWFVFLECCKLGIPWRGLVHDLSKFLPSEWFAYVDFFHGKGRKKAIRDSTGYYKPTDTGHAGFDFAWLLHQKRNQHHWQWFVLPEDEGGLKVLEMSKGARKEMLADWYGAGRAQGTPDTRAWYRRHWYKLQLHPDTRAWVDRQLGMVMMKWEDCPETEGWKLCVYGKDMGIFPYLEIMYAKDPGVGMCLFLDKKLDGLPGWVKDRAWLLAKETWKETE